jgi:hypothetical protein
MRDLTRIDQLIPGTNLTHRTTNQIHARQRITIFVRSLFTAHPGRHWTDSDDCTRAGTPPTRRSIGAWLLLSITGAASFWLVFGRTRLWIRYLIFNIVFFVLPFIASVSGPGSPTQIFSALGVCFAVQNFLLVIVGFKVIRRVPYSANHSTDSEIATDQFHQFTLRNLFQVTLFVALTMAVYVVWDRTLGLHREDLVRFFSRSVSYVLIFVNLVSLVCTLAPRKLVLWIAAGVGILFGLTEMLRLPGSDNGIYYLLLFYTVWMFVYSVPRVRGYRWSWQAPWKNQVKKPLINEPPIRDSSRIDDANPLIPSRRENAPIPPPLPAHPPGFQQIAEPPIVASHSGPPPLPNSDE